eukprot:m.16152 g.16152  ORF g.16152 m.16152 type:complete len:334 (+) comp3479_c1_seq1:261-1262(+)
MPRTARHNQPFSNTRSEVIASHGALMCELASRQNGTVCWHKELLDGGSELAIVPRLMSDIVVGLDDVARIPFVLGNFEVLLQQLAVLHWVVVVGAEKILNIQDHHIHQYHSIGVGKNAQLTWNGNPSAGNSVHEAHASNVRADNFVRMAKHDDNTQVPLRLAHDLGETHHVGQLCLLAPATVVGIAHHTKRGRILDVDKVSPRPRPHASGLLRHLDGVVQKIMPRCAVGFSLHVGGIALCHTKAQVLGGATCELLAATEESMPEVMPGALEPRKKHKARGFSVEDASFEEWRYGGREAVLAAACLSPLLHAPELVLRLFRRGTVARRCLGASS